MTSTDNENINNEPSDSLNAETKDDSPEKDSQPANDEKESDDTAAKTDNDAEKNQENDNPEGDKPAEDAAEKDESKNNEAENTENGDAPENDKQENNEPEADNTESKDKENEVEESANPENGKPEEDVPKEEAADDEPGKDGSQSLSPVQNGSLSSLRGNVPSPHQQERINVTLILPLEKRYTCPQCNEVLRYPLKFEECGHHVCSPCFYEFLRVEPRCPIDQGHIDKDKAILNTALHQEIMVLDAKCGNTEWGCKWEGSLQETQGHMDKCEYVDILCINDCGAKFQRRFLQKHLDKDCAKKIIVCAFCDDRFLREEKRTHLEDCMKVPLPCPNRCDKKLTIARDQLDNHIEQECPRTKIVCQFEEIGCPHKCSREKLSKHYKIGIIEHVRLLYDVVMKESQRLDQHQELIKDHNSLLETHQSQIADMERVARNQLIWRIDEYTRKMKEAKSGNTTTLFSPPFNTSKHGYRLCASLCLNGDGKGKGTHISAFVSILRGAYDNLLKWPFSYRVTFFLLDQNSDPASRKHIKFSIKPNPCADNEPFLGQPKMEKNASFGGAKFAKHEDCESRTYIRDDTIFIKIAIDCDGSAEP